MHWNVIIGVSEVYTRGVQPRRERLSDRPCCVHAIFFDAQDCVQRARDGYALPGAARFDEQKKEVVEGEYAIGYFLYDIFVEEFSEEVV